ncbi:hypothetical protein BKA69DRAFT_1121032 [Paraphysoderma sedebokerense]|nr:hypothetical protein BKA69DRAFT_1121032 [Paraphysoderma sedebokerense]
MKQLECRRKCSPKQCKCFYIDLLRLEEECDYWGSSFEDVAEDSVDVKMAQNRMEIDDRLEGFGIGIDKIAQAAATCCAEAICEGNNTVQMILEQHLKSKCSACTTTSAKSRPTKRMVVDVDDVFVQILSSGQAANKEYATISTQMITDKVKLHLDPSIGPRFQSLTLTMTNVSRSCSCGPTINIQVGSSFERHS